MKALVPVFLIAFCFSCQTDNGENATSTLTGKEKLLCDSIRFDQAILTDIRSFTSAPVEAFHYSLSKSIDSSGNETELDPIYMPGLVFEETEVNTERILEELHDRLKTKGYYLFVLERNYGMANQKDMMAILKTTDQFEVLEHIETNGINYGIETDSLVKIMREFDKKYRFDLIGANGEWCEFIIKGENVDWKELAEEAYRVCPDIVDQGVGSMEDLITSMQQTKRLYFWWD